jgi:hypothetical protein
MPSRYLSVNNPWAKRRERDHADAEFVDRVEQVVLDPAIEHRVRGLMDEQRHAHRRAGFASASRVFSAEYDDTPAYRALPCCTALARAPIVSSSGVSGSKRCE